MEWYMSFVFSNLSMFCLLANISILTVINTKGRLIMRGKALRWVRREFSRETANIGG